MKGWIPVDNTDAEQQDIVEDTYEDVEEEVFPQDKTVESASKSMHDLSVESNGNLMNSRSHGQIGGSLYSVQTTNNQSLGRGRPTPGGRGSLFKSGGGRPTPGGRGSLFKS